MVPGVPDSVLSRHDATVYHTVYVSVPYHCPPNTLQSFEIPGPHLLHSDVFESPILQHGNHDQAVKHLGTHKITVSTF